MISDKKIAMLFPYAPSYREPIYRLMDSELDIDWYFCGNAKRNLKFLDYKILHNCNLDMQERTLPFRFSYYRGFDRMDWDSYDIIIFAGVIRCLSEWKLILKPRSRRPRLLLWTHGWYGSENILQRIVKKLFFSRADGLLLYGNYARECLIREGLPAEKLHVIYNSLDYDSQLPLRAPSGKNPLSEHFGNDRKNLIFIGRLTQDKRLDLLLEALALLKKKGERYNLTAIGDGEDRQYLERRCRELGLEGSVWFYGECFDEAQNAEMLRCAELCVSPGHVGLTAMHAMMFGCPVITHDNFTKQAPEFEAIHPGVTGDFFKEGNVMSLTACLSGWFHRTNEGVQNECEREIDGKWNPHVQMETLKKIIGI